MITGDLNVRFDRSDDPWCLKVNELLSAYGLEQHVRDQTHTRGGTLDIVAMAYLGLYFKKGANFCWTLVLTQRGRYFKIFS